MTNVVVQISLYLHSTLTTKDYFILYCWLLPLANQHHKVKHSCVRKGKVFHLCISNHPITPQKKCFLVPFLDIDIYKPCLPKNTACVIISQLHFHKTSMNFKKVQPIFSCLMDDSYAESKERKTTEMSGCSEQQQQRHCSVCTRWVHRHYWVWVTQSLATNKS